MWAPGQAGRRVLVLLADHIGWKGAYLYMAALMLVGIVATLFAPEVESFLSCEICPSYARQPCFLNETDRTKQFDGILLLSFFRLKDGANNDGVSLLVSNKFAQRKFSHFNLNPNWSRFFQPNP